MPDGWRLTEGLPHRWSLARKERGYGPSRETRKDDADKLEVVADWFDAHDRKHGVDDSEVQRDLRRMAEYIRRGWSHD